MSNTTSNNSKLAGLVFLALGGFLPMAGQISAQQPDTGGVNLRSGDPVAGKAIYTKVCISCHGDKAQGNQALNAPRLLGQEPWYMARQLKNFQQGLRGTDPKDLFGMQMRPMAMTLQGDQDIAAVVAYIVSLNSGGSSGK
jgi:cytochrome c oxidase subunit 2